MATYQVWADITELAPDRFFVTVSAVPAHERNEERTGGVWRPSPGSVYPTLQLLEDEDLIAGEEGEGRRRFTLTDAGRAEAERQDQQAPWEQAVAGVTPTTRAAASTPSSLRATSRRRRARGRPSPTGVGP